MIKNPKRFGQWLPAFFDGEFEWDFLSYAFSPTKIMPMDFDAVVERNGHFMVCETKAEGKQIDTGQSITLTTAWKQKGFTVFHIEGKTAPEITGFAVYWEWDKDKVGRVGDKPMMKGNATDLLYVVACWFAKANNLPKPSRDTFDDSLWLDDYVKAQARYWDK
jgi:hypothetical protein